MYKRKLNKKIGFKHKRKTERLNTSNKRFTSLILTVPLSQIYSQTNKRVISNVELKGLGPEKILIK